MAITLVQSAKGTSALATTTAAFSTTPTNGNLIVLCFAGDDYNGTPDTGWTQETGMEQQTFHGGYLWWRIAAGGTNSFQYTIGSASNSSWLLMEFSGVAASPYDVSVGAFQQSSGSSYLSTALTPTTGARLVIVANGQSAGGNTLAANTESYDSSFTYVDGVGTAPSATRISAAYLLPTANGSTSYTTTMTQTAGNTFQTVSAMSIAFKAAGGGTTYNDTRTETVTTSDTDVAVATFANTFTESTAATTAETSKATFASTLAESVASGDSFVGNTQLTITDSITTGEASTSVATFVNTRAESVATGDAEVSAATFVTTLTEGATTSDTWNGVGGTVQTETAVTGDTFTSLISGTSAVAESATVNDGYTVSGAGIAVTAPGSGSSSAKTRKKTKKRVTLWEAPPKTQKVALPQEDIEEKVPVRSDPMISGRAPDFANLFGIPGNVQNEPPVARTKPTVQQDIAALVRLMHRL